MYDSKEIEKKWIAYWKEQKLFQFDEKDKDSQLYVIDSPPPFTSGSMSMGTALYSLMDVIARYKHMKGYNVLFPQGWDMQGFPTEKAVEKKFGKNLPREEFYKKCAELSHENAAKMKEQMRGLGFTFDERYEYRTASPEYWAKVQLSLLMMFEKGFVYRESHPVEFCWNCGSAIAHAEINDREEETTINHVEFAVPSAKKKITIATTRPELMHVCVAIAVNPSDKRYTKMIGAKAKVPINDKLVEIIGDEKVDQEFGTGAEMVCTFGDKADVEMYYAHKLKLIPAMDEKGMLLNAGDLTGVHIKKAKEQAVEKLKASGALIKQEKLKHTIRIHDRCETPVELLSSMQWFIKTKEHIKKIKELANEVKWSPEFTKQRMIDWADGLGWDWTISRNRVFGTPIPFWYCEKCNEIIAPDKKKLPVDPARDQSPKSKCPKCGGKVVGEKATCDVWIDSSITPLVIAGWPEKKDWERFMPNALRFQGVDIIRTWAFYTLFRVWALTGKKAWEEALVHSMILAPDGRMMHRSWGNVITPDEVFAKGYSSDALRLWAAIGGAIGKDRPFTYNDIEYAKGFIVKLFNTANFVKTALAQGEIPKKEPHKDFNVFDIWILNRLNVLVSEMTEAYDSFTFFEAMNKAINFYWHEFADYYIENVKHRVYSTDKKGAKSKGAALFTLKYVLDTSLKLFAPVIPFVSEELNSMFNKGSIFEQKFPVFTERPHPADYVINGVIQRSNIEIDYDSVGIALNQIIGDIRKQKAQARIALNKEITSILINVPDTYISAVEAASDEIKSICKASKVSIKKGKEFSVSIQA